MSSDITVLDITEKRGSDKLTGVFDGVVVKKDQQTNARLTCFVASSPLNTKVMRN